MEYNFSDGMVSSVNETDLYETVMDERLYLEISAKGTSLQIVNLLRKENLITLLYNIKGGNIEGESAKNFNWGSEYELIEKRLSRNLRMVH